MKFHLTTPTWVALGVGAGVFLSHPKAVMGIGSSTQLGEEEARVEYQVLRSSTATRELSPPSKGGAKESKATKRPTRAPTKSPTFVPTASPSISLAPTGVCGFRGQRCCAGNLCAPSLFCDTFQDQCSTDCGVLNGDCCPTATIFGDGGLACAPGSSCNTASGQCELDDQCGSRAACEPGTQCVIDATGGIPGACTPCGGVAQLCCNDPGSFCNKDLTVVLIDPNTFVCICLPGTCLA
jgi:hypothetical protein